jgi:hypothetical protein
MATTTNYSWTTPDDTDLVKDGAAAIRTLGSSIDTTTKNLNPSTTLGDIEYRSSTSNVNTRLALGTANKVLKVNSSATAPEWAVDPTTDVVTTAGDLIYGTAADTVTRLGIGTANQVLRVNSGATAPEWATAVSTPASASARVETAQELTSATYTDLTTAGPAVTLTTGTKVLVIVSTQIYTTGSSQTGFMDFAVSGATTRSASDSTAVAMTCPTAYVNEQYASRASRITVTAGSNTFTAKYRESGSSQAGFQYREICVIDLGS